MVFENLLPCCGRKGHFIMSLIFLYSKKTSYFYLAFWLLCLHFHNDFLLSRKSTLDSLMDTFIIHGATRLADMFSVLDILIYMYISFSSHSMNSLRLALGTYITCRFWYFLKPPGIKGKQSCYQGFGTAGFSYRFYCRLTKYVKLCIILLNVRYGMYLSSYGTYLLSGMVCTTMSNCLHSQYL